MADEKKHPNAPADKLEAPTVTLPATTLAELIAAAVDKRVAEIMTATTVDERMQTAMNAMRGKNIPPTPEELIACRSPVTGATFTARVVLSRAYPLGRIVELLDYARPAGWDVHKDDGGLYDGVRESMRINPETGERFIKFRQWTYKTFWMSDWNAISGKPTSFLAHWRVTATDKAAE